MRILCFGALLALSLTAQAAEEAKTYPLWPEGAPGALGKETGDAFHAGDVPTITVYRPEPGKANGSAIVICPGGGYGFLATEHEGSEVARWLNSLGITGVMLKYRLGPKYHHPVMIEDAQRAIRTARARAKEWELNPKRVGVMGFSAGGHLASTAATHFDSGKSDASDPIDRESCRPSVAILVYPVIALATPYGHSGSLKNLLGDSPSKELVESLSNEQQVTKDTPPTFLAHTNADTGVVPENSLLFALALRKAKVPVELHLFEKGPHGLGLGTGWANHNLPPNEAFQAWPALCATWLKGQGFLARATTLAGDKLRLLIVDGQNNHDWKSMTPVMRETLEKTGRFAVDVATTPGPGAKEADWEKFQPEFSKYDVVLSNYNGQPWPKRVQDALESYVAGGGGLVIIHAANNAFPDWTEFNKMIGLGWRGNNFGDRLTLDDNGKLVRTPKGEGPGAGHGRQHDYKIVVRESSHPVTKGMPAEWMHPNDELYHGQRGPAENMEILATAYSAKETGGTGTNEPMIWVIPYGKGRVFTSLLGHVGGGDTTAIRCIGFQTVMARGSEWAATGKVTLPIPANFPTTEAVSVAPAEPKAK